MKNTLIILAAITLLPISAVAGVKSHHGHDAVSDSVIAKQRHMRQSTPAVRALGLRHREILIQLLARTHVPSIQLPPLPR